MTESGGSDSVAITASLGTGSEFSTPRIARFVRDRRGTARPAASGDNGLLSQGSDDTAAAARLAQRIGLSRRQLIQSGQTVDVTVRFSLPAPVDVTLSCRPDGGGRMNGRDTLVFSCTGSEAVRNEDFVGQLRVAGVEELDIRSGVRLASQLSGRLDGENLSADGSHRQAASNRLLYSLDTEFE
jgi:hypothetical protein